MTTIFKDGMFQEESWTRVEPEADLPQNRHILVPVATFLAHANALKNRGNFGVEVAPPDKVEELAAHLDELPLISVVFPSFADGRAFSAARILREQMAYKGDIRATGSYILDQVPLARRCGVSSFEIVKPEVLKALKAGEWPEVTKYLQPVGTVHEIPEGTRPWARRSVRELPVAAE
ncbi:uncharacterized protein (DUF934 family) [Roseibium hamelinense]|uniref:Uncharacterized protein (DUF934 family) n=1 Tax=Roseibium hamelinense TaxID=150831 RepID=A0A562T2R2_9HYPH|nr:DUF934 domain-containing protein [Roseibium hamelinense]MTI44535.1 DUF934 domain-containing protein [Roseibium hamelinense]TWI87504.1 uncharacterized protein (DUF934 family) [Roseibium hamelinense]